jgi:hypothetical protein
MNVPSVEATMPARLGAAVRAAVQRGETGLIHVPLA